MCLLVLTSTVQSKFIMSSRTCLKQEMPLSHKIYQLYCRYRRPGVYIYEGPTTVKTLIIDRLTEEAHVVVNGLTTLKEVKILTGTEKNMWTYKNKSATHC